MAKLATNPKPDRPKAITPSKSKPLLERSFQLTPISNYEPDCYERVRAPVVPEKSIDIYKRYVESPEMIYSNLTLTDSSFALIHKYASSA